MMEIIPGSCSALMGSWSAIGYSMDTSQVLIASAALITTSLLRYCTFDMVGCPNTVSLTISELCCMHNVDLPWSDKYVN